MVKPFADKRTAAIFEGYFVEGLPTGIQRRARAKLMAIHAATALDFLRAPPANHPEEANRPGPR
ncbi:MAG: type II toxin-antitoxin system RelE/ParE family toxin [Acidiferrobacterales bacterium]